MTALRKLKRCLICRRGRSLTDFYPCPRCHDVLVERDYETFIEIWKGARRPSRFLGLLAASSFLPSRMEDRTPEQRERLRRAAAGIKRKRLRDKLLSTPGLTPKTKNHIKRVADAMDAADLYMAQRKKTDDDNHNRE